MQFSRLDLKIQSKRAASWLTLWTVLFCLLGAVIPSQVWATNTIGDKTATLTINLNDNGNVTTVAVLTVSDLQNMTQHQSSYSTINNNSNVFFYGTEGVLVTDILAAVHIDLDNIDKFKFTATDNYSRTFTKEYLLATKRYYYPDILNNYSTQGGIQVQPTLALKSQEVSEKSRLDLSKADDYYSARLFFGQTNQDLISNQSYVKWVSKIELYTKALSVQPPALIADTVNNAAGQPISLIFTDDQAWRDAITDVTVDGTSIAGKYMVAAGTISIDGSVLPGKKDYAIVVKANGYQDTATTQHKGAWPVIMTLDGNSVVSHLLTASDLRNMPATTIQFGANTCKGVALKDLLTSLNITDPSWQAQINVTDAATYRIDPVSVASLLDPTNKYLLTYDVDGQPITIGPDNQTPLRINWGLGVVYKHVTGITISKKGETSTGQYVLTPVADASYTNGKTIDGINTMTVNSGITGLKYFTVNVNSVQVHNAKEAVVFVHLRDGEQLNINVTKADFDSITNAAAGFNVQAGDIIKVYIVDDLTDAPDFNPTLLQ